MTCSPFSWALSRPASSTTVQSYVGGSVRWGSILSHWNALTRTQYTSAATAWTRPLALLILFIATPKNGGGAGAWRVTKGRYTVVGVGWPGTALAAAVVTARVGPGTRPPRLSQLADVSQTGHSNAATARLRTSGRPHFLTRNAPQRCILLLQLFRFVCGTGPSHTLRAGKRTGCACVARIIP